MAESGGDVLEHDREGEETIKHGDHNIHVDDTEVVVEEDSTDEEKEDEATKFWIRGSTPITEFEAGIIQGWEHEFVVNMTNVRAPTSFTNMLILDEEHAIEIYA